MLTACTGPRAEDPVPTASVTLSESLPCTNTLKTSPLPEWARAGFSPPETPVAHVAAVRGDMVGVVFGYPLHAPKPEPGHGNKILWVGNPDAAVGTHDGTATPGKLNIHATLNGTGLTADRAVAVGPSYVDMPRAGCWTFTLTWGSHQDQVAVPYEPT